MSCATSHNELLKEESRVRERIQLAWAFRLLANRSTVRRRLKVLQARRLLRSSGDWLPTPVVSIPESSCAVGCLIRTSYSG